MKTTSSWVRMMALALCLVMALALPGFTPSALADDEAEPANAAIQAIMETGDQKYIVLPQEESCLGEFKTRYVAHLDYDWVTPTLYKCKQIVKEQQKVCGPAIPVERISALRTGRQPMPWAYEGTKVRVVAEENDMSCILYLSSENKLRAGWVQSRFLVDEFPGQRLSIGSGSGTGTPSTREVKQSWSGKGFLNSLQNYTVLEEPVSNCTSFTMDYQLIQENTCRWGAIYGPRTVYVNDGSEWIEVGTFEYPQSGTVKVTVNLSRPTDICAFGTIANVSLPNTFRFRQVASDFVTAG